MPTLHTSRRRREGCTLLSTGEVSNRFDKMASKLPKNAMSIKQFMVHQEVIKLYRGFMRSLRDVDNEVDRKQFLEWVREDFRKHKNETDDFAIKNLLMNGQKMLKELQQSIGMSRS